MDITYLNIIAFVLVTLGYFLALKAPLQVSTLANDDAMAQFKKQSYMRLIGYFIFVVLFQFGINTSSVVSRCGGSFTRNMGSAAFWTVLPWTLIFGVMMVILVIKPGFKSAFSNILGYYYISHAANQLLSELIVDAHTEAAIDKSFAASETVNGSTKEEVQDVQEALLSLSGNLSILINKMTPSNFLQFWNLLLPLMKSRYRDFSATGELSAKQEELLKLIVAKDDIGEGFWYGYTALLLITMIQYYINTLTCNKSVDQMQQEYASFLAKEEKEKAAKAQKMDINYQITQ